MSLDGAYKWLIGYDNIIVSFYQYRLYYVIQLLSAIMHVKGRMVISNVSGNENVIPVVAL